MDCTLNRTRWAENRFTSITAPIVQPRGNQKATHGFRSGFEGKNAGGAKIWQSILTNKLRNTSPIERDCVSSLMSMRKYIRTASHTSAFTWASVPASTMNADIASSTTVSFSDDSGCRIILTVGQSPDGASY